MRLLTTFVVVSSLFAAPALAGDAPKPKAPEAKTEAKIDAKAPEKAEVGKPAPGFTLKDLDGKEVTLASYKGKIVVLEWFNPGCPYVKKSHTVGSLVDTAKKHMKNGVVWLAINSSAPGREGNELSMNTEAVKAFGLANPVLRDEAGTVGKAYGATNTPHMFVIDKKGVLAYAGAIDNSPDAEQKSAPDGKLVNYVDDAIAAVTAGKPVQVATSKAYGCSVKYAK